MQSGSLKLELDLVPATCWYKNLRNHMRRSDWDKLRRKVYTEQGNVCVKCGAKGYLNCHEVWDYDDERHIQRLTGFRAVCSMCHHVMHFGMAQILASKGQLNLNAVIEHFLKVNGVDRKVFEAHKVEAFRIWQERSKHQWQADLGEWSSIVDTNK